MVGKNNQYLKTTKEGTRVESYSIKKFKVGTASVVIGASIFLGAGAVAQASEEVSNNTTADNTTNAGAKEDAPKAVEKTAKVENTKESVAAVVAAKVGAETPKTEAKAEVKKEVLKATIATLEENLKSAQDADQAAVAAAKEALAAAKAVLANEAATQAEVDTQADAVSALNVVITEAKTKAFDKKLEAKKAEEQKEKEAKATKEEKEVATVKKELTQVASEAQVTNTLAKTELSKKDLKVEAKPAVEKAVVKNEEALKLAKELLGNDKATKEQIAKSLEELSNSIKAVYAELENAGAKRNGKFDVVLADATSTALKDATAESGKKWLEQNGYSSLDQAPKYIKGNADDDKAIKNLNNQIQWLDFGDAAAWTNRKPNGQLQVGSVYEKELMPGYIVKMTVKELKPFHSTEIYKNRVAGTSHESSYKPNEENIFNTVTKNPFATGIGGNAQTGYTHVKNAGLDTGSAKTTISATDDNGYGRQGQIVGIKFDIEATYNGKPVKPGIVMTSGEDIGDLETEIYTTNGTPWDLAAVVGSTNGHTDMYKPHPNFNRLNEWGGDLNKWTSDELRNALDGKMFATKDAATAGLGSQVFGGYMNTSSATPIVSTANVSEIGFYIMSSGEQSSMIGVKFSDFGDLPESYGSAEHYLRTQAKDYKTNQINQIQQPYLGTVKADIDSVSGTRVRGVGSDDTKEQGDEGVAQLIAPENVHTNVDNGEPEVKLVQAEDNTYRVKVIASANGNDKYTGTVEPAYVRGFIDFNGNGKFDEGEASEVVTVTGNQETVELVFRNTQIIDTTKDMVNFRTRIATDRKQIEKPVGIAFSGEVEDNQIQVALPPRGDKEETTGKQGETQSVGIEFRTRPLGDDASDLGSNNGKTTFNSYGKINYTEQSNVISAETTKKVQSEGVMIVNPDGTLTKTYTKAGQGTYTVTDDKITFTPEANFVGKADGIVLRAVDSNGQSTGWTALTDQNGLENINDGTHSATKKTMDAVYIPTVTPKEITADPETSTDVQGKEQKKTPTFKTEGDSATPVTPSAQYPAKLVDPKTGDKVDSVTVEGEGTYTINPETGEVKFQPLPTFTGTASGVDVTLTAPVGQDKDGQPVTATATTKYTPTVTAVTPTADPATSTGVQGETQKGTPTFTEGNTDVPIKEGSVKLLNPDGTEATGPVDALDPSGKKVGEYTVDPTTGVVTFTPTDKSYTGPVQPAKVQAEDKNGTKVSTTYTPTIVGVTPKATPATTEDVQGKTQESPVSFEGGKTTIAGKEKSVDIDPATYTLLGEDGQPATEVPAKDPNGKVIGKYTLKTVDGKAVAVFEPTDKTYSGEVQPVKVQAKDKNGTAVETTYTPKITPVTPTAEPKETTDIQGKEQNGKPEFKPGNPDVPMDDEVPATFEDGSTTKTIPGEGTYTVAPDGTVTFTPEKNFTGKGTGVTVKRVDKNGTPVTAKYTPTVTPVTPTGTDAVTEEVQGKEQTGKPTFKPGNPDVPMDDKVPATFEDGSTEKVIPGEGTYTVAPDGTVTFTPEKGFTGKGTGVTVKRVDKNGTPVTAKYTPVVKPTVPTSTDVITTNVQGATQSGTPTFEGGKVTVNGEEKTVEIDETVKPTFEDGTTEKKVPGEGTYTIDENGKVTFTPEKTFKGQATGVTVKRVDKNGTPVTAKYTPVVVPVTPTSKDSESEGPKGQPQSGTPTFEGGKVTINGKEVPVEIDETVKPTFEDGTTEKKVPGEGTYTIDENGKVTFTPEPNFVGKASGVTVKRVDKNGTPVTAKYTPTVRPDTSYVDKDGNPLSPSEDGTKPTKDIPGYKVVKTEIDENGNTKHIYEKVTTTYKDKDGNVIPGTTTEEGTNPKKDIPGYRFVETKKLPNGDTEHVYEKVKTSFKDKEGNEIPNYPTEDGDQPKKDIPGYRFVETKKLPNGDVEHVYEKVKTSFKDKEGNEIPNYPTEDGDQPKKDIPGYRFVETKKLPNGDTQHVYEKVANTTIWTDEEGNPLKPPVNGIQVPGEIPGYELVRTVTDKDGNVRHIFKKTSRIPGENRTTTWTDENGNPLKPSERGTVDAGKIPGYEFVRTVVGEDGNVRHIFRKVTNTKAGQRLANTGTTETNTGLAGLGMAILGGLLAIKRRKNDKN